MRLNLDTFYVKSPHMQVVQKGDNAVIWHSLFGYPKVISVETLNFLNSFSEATKISSRLSNDLSKESKKVPHELFRCHFLVPVNFDDRAFLERRMCGKRKEISNGSLISYLELIMSEACNFRCTYCIHFNNLQNSARINGSEKFMRFEMAKEIIDRYLEILHKHKKDVAEINFGGGEPLLVWPVIKQVLEYCCATYNRRFKFCFSINTNLSLVTLEIAMTLKKYQVRTASSLDGLREGNDRVRLTKLGGGTFDRIIRGFKILADAGYPLDGFAVTVTKDNFFELDESIIDWAITHNMKEVRIDVDVIGMMKIPVKDIVSKLMRIRNYASLRGVDIPGFWSRPVENLSRSTLKSHVSFCGAVRGNSMCVNSSGEIYSCGYSTTRLGSLPEIESFFVPNTPYYRFVEKNLTGAIEMCRGCMIEG